MTRTALLLALTLSACSPSAFVCQSDAQCGADGMCEASGWCSFPDPDCPSGQRLGEHSGDGLAGMCVPEGGESTGMTTAATNSTTSSSATSSSDASDATVTMTSAIGSEGSSGDDTLAPDTSDTATTGSTGETGDPELGPIVWYTFDDPDALLADASGHGRDATCPMGACPTAVDGVVGMAASFDGVSQYAELEHEVGLETMDALSVSVWVSPDELGTGTWQAAVDKPIGDGDVNSWEIGLEADSTGFSGCVSDGTDIACVETPWPRIQTWHHAALTWDGATVRFYFDGEMVDSTPGTAIGFDDHPMLLGADIDSEEISRFFAGSLDEVRVYDRALADDEVAALAAQ